MNQEDEKLGIENVIALVDYGLDVADDVEQANKDGVVNWKDVPVFAGTAIKLPSIIKKAPKAWPEILDMDIEERAALNKHVAERLNCTNDEVEDVVKAALDVAVCVSQTVDSTLDLVKAIKALKN